MATRKLKCAAMSSARWQREVDEDAERSEMGTLEANMEASAVIPE